MKNIHMLIMFMLLSKISTSQQYVWTQKTAPPVSSGIYDPASFSINNKVYFAGGSDSGLINTFNNLWEYTPLTDTWAQKANMPGNGAYGCRAFVINNEGYVYTGWWRNATNIFPVQVNFKYSPVSNSWSTETPFPDNDRYAGITFAIDGKGYYATGFAPITNDLWEFDPAANWWTQKANLPAQARLAGVGINIGGLGYAGFGGLYSNQLVDWWAYNPNINSWTQKANFPDSARSVPAHFILNDEAYIIGGTDYDHTPFQNVYKYNPINDAWTFIGVFPGGPRFSMAMGQANGKGYIGQGSHTTQTTFQYFTTNDWWEFSIATSINETLSAGGFSISPNPANEFITLTYLEKNMVSSSINIYDEHGKLVLKKTNANSGEKININFLSNGYYIIEINFGNKIVTQKFIKA